jgi:hypothetical protein
VIILDFPDDATVFEDDLRGRHPYEIEEAAYLVTMFEFPVRFAVNGVEFREHRPRPPRPGLAGDGWITQGDQGDKGEDCLYSPMPLIGFALSLQRGARMSGIRNLGGIRLVPRPRGAVRVEVQLGSRSAVAPEEELRLAADDFARRVKRSFLDRVPEIKRHPKWSEWFPDEVRT